MICRGKDSVTVPLKCGGKRQGSCAPFLTRDATTYWLNRYWFLVLCLKCRENRSTTQWCEANGRDAPYVVHSLPWRWVDTADHDPSRYPSGGGWAWWETFFCFWRDFVFKRRPVWFQLLYAIQLQIDKVSTYTPIGIPNNFFGFYGSRQLPCCKSWIMQKQANLHLTRLESTDRLTPLRSLNIVLPSKGM